MNLIEAADELEFVPKDQLAGFVNDPNSRYPSYLVLSEIQRRTQLEKAYNAEQAAMQPNTTVADEVVANFTGQGLASAMPQSSMPQPEMPQAGLQMGASPLPQENVMPSGIQGMAEGGITGYANEGYTVSNLSAGQLDNSPAGQLDRLNEKGIGNIKLEERQRLAEELKRSSLFPQTTEFPLLTDRSWLNISNLEKDKAQYEKDNEIIREIPDEIKNFGLSKVDFSAPTKEERQKDLNVSALAGMAKIFGSATNLGEAGAGLGALATDIQGIRKASRKEDRDLQMQQRTASAQDFEIAAKKDTIKAQREKVVQDNRSEVNKINQTIAVMTQAQDKTAYEGAIEKLKMEWEGSKTALTTVTDGMRDQVLLETAKAAQNRTLVQLVTELVREKQDLRPSDPADLPRLNQINAQLEGITDQIFNSMGVKIPKGDPFTGATKDQQ
mgnify:FL=1